MNKLLLLLPVLLLTACVKAEMNGVSTKEYNTSDSVKNTVGPHGELISPPDCPNWKASPYNTQDNAKQGNFGCATTTNLGLMLEDPRDLVRGSSGGHISPDPTRSADVIKNYRSGLANPSSTGGESYSTSTATSAPGSSQ